MIELYAITHRDDFRPGPSDSYERPHRRESRRAGVRIGVIGQEPVDSCFFDSPQLTLVCKTDLIGEKKSATAQDLANLYLECDDEFVPHLRGAFAIVVYDYRQRILKAWTDHFGIERLVFAGAGESLTVASDIPLLLSLCDRSPSVDPAAILEYMLYTCIPAPRTIFSGVSKLPPAHQLVSHPSPRTCSYWDMKYVDTPKARRSETAWASDTLGALRSAVAVNLAGLDGKSRAGCFLSGGTDSSSVSALAAQATGKSPRTFSIGFDDPRYNEIEYARIAANHIRADHHEYFVKPDDILELVQKAVPVYDEPFGNSSIVPTYYCARLAAQHGITHLLAGDGGDELFGGNARYVDDRVFQRYAVAPKLIRKWMVEPAVSAAGSATGLAVFRKAASYVRRANIPEPDRYFSYSFVASFPRHELFTSDFLEAANNHDPLETARNHFHSASAGETLNRWLYLDLKITITDNDLRKVTAMSRLAGVTPRYPLLNPDLAEFTGSVPAHLKVKGSQLRYLFKKAVRQVLPPEIIKKKKHGFGLPYAVWLASDRHLYDFTFDVLGSARCRQRGYFRRDLFNWVWSEYQSSHRGYYGEILWMLLMLELWHIGQADRLPAMEREVTTLRQLK